MLAAATQPGRPRVRGGEANATRAPLATIATIVALGLGIGLRLWRPDLGQLNFDESNVGSLVAAWKYQGSFPLAGTVSSYGFRAGPAWPWFAAISLQWTDDPYGLLAIGLVGGIGGLLACWWVARRWLGGWGGVAAALMHGTMFWCVLLERGVWQPVFLQAPMALCLDALLRLGVNRRPWALAIACGWLGILVSVHYTAVAFVLVVLLAMWYARGVLNPIHIATAVVVGALPLVPFAVYEVNPSVRFQDVSDLLSLSRGTSIFDFETISSTIQISSTLGAAGLGGHAGADIAAELGRWNELSLLAPVLATAGMLVGVFSRPRGATAWLITAWTLAPIVAYLRHSAPIIFHYMFIEFTGLGVSVGMLGAWAAASRLAWLRVAIGGAVAVCAAASGVSMLVLLNGLDRWDFSAGYGVPIRYSREAGALARAAVPGGGVVLIGDDPHAGEVLRFGLGYATPSRTFEDCRAVPYVADAVYLLASEQTPGWQALEQAGAPLLARLPRPGGDAYRLYGAPVAAPGPFAAGASQECADRAAWDGPGG